MAGVRQVIANKISLLGERVGLCWKLWRKNHKLLNHSQSNKQFNDLNRAPGQGCCDHEVIICKVQLYPMRGW